MLPAGQERSVQSTSASAASLMLFTTHFRPVLTTRFIFNTNVHCALSIVSPVLQNISLR